MRARTGISFALFAALLAMQAGCAASLAPGGWLPDAQQAQHEAYGAWMEMVVGDPADTLRVHGELLAIGDDSVYTVSGTRLTVTALTSVRQAQLEVFDTRAGSIAGLALLGTLLTPTMGVVLVAGAPLWVIVGVLSSSAQAEEGRHGIDTSAPVVESAPEDSTEERRETWLDLRLYARFPQGLPAGLDRSRLRERPLANPEASSASSPR